ncbi:MAG: GNAT family N-acetyltransferase [Alphaproteobacteria bacterium]|nr:GNAT family N-acetyltransferase [Alphaproteobacteria bacterium]
MQYNLRNATPEDKPWLESLRRQVYAYLFEKTWGGWDEERHQRHFSACWESGHIQIIEAGSRPVGMLQVFESDENIEIGEIQIVPDAQGQGLGKTVLNDIIEKARNSSKELTLATGLKNDGAVKLYKALGFEETERSETHVHMCYLFYRASSCL